MISIIESVDRSAVCGWDVAADVVVAAPVAAPVEAGVVAGVAVDVQSVARLGEDIVGSQGVGVS